MIHFTISWASEQATAADLEVLTFSHMNLASHVSWFSFHFLKHYFFHQICLYSGVSFFLNTTFGFFLPALLAELHFSFPSIIVVESMFFSSVTLQRLSEVSFNFAINLHTQIPSTTLDKPDSNSPVRLQ